MRTKQQIENEIARLEEELDSVLEDMPEETSRIVLKRGKVLRNLYYVSEYTMAERFYGGELLSASQILGSCDWKKGTEVVIFKDFPEWWMTEDAQEDGYLLKYDSPHVQEI